MTERIDPRTTDLSRRDFLSAAAGLTLALTVTPDPLAILDQDLSGAAMAEAALSPNVWLTVATDGTITIVSPAAEMGQGTFTTLPAIIADEFDADWTKVKPVFPPEWNERKFGNPGYNNFAFQTSASFAVRGYFKAMRIAGAQARRVLIDAVAAKLRALPRRRPNCRKSRRRISKPPRASATSVRIFRGSKCRSK